MNNYRIYVEKYPEFQVEARSLLGELNENLQLDLAALRLLNVYDLFGFSEELLEKSRYSVFGEIVTDSVTDECDLSGSKYIAVEYLPGQFDQRAASAVDCVRLIDPSAKVSIKSSKLIIIPGETSDETVENIKKYYINAVESREKDLAKLTALEQPEVAPVPVLEGLTALTEEELAPYCKKMGLAMNADDLREVVNYFKSEGRDPFETELRILDTYWSDHCRHTTFTTELEEIEVEDSFLKEELDGTLALYMKIRKELGREHKGLNLMDMATVGARYLKANGLLDDMEVSEENNACSIYVDVDIVDDEGEMTTEKWLLQFKNETHNHPTEIEPFGGAATCLGGAIRDPLSGRAYVYQAMRVTGAGDIIFSGAGLPLNLPSFLTEGAKTKLAPIVSSARAAKLLCEKWFNEYNYTPDAIVVEGPKAGGHLGYKADQIFAEEYSLEKTLPEVVEVVDKFAAEHNCHIPVIAAGGIYTGEDIHNMMELGASGVQMGTRFVTTEECDADIRFKEAYINAKKEDIEIIQSPVGMPGRAVHSSFLASVKEGLKKPKQCAFNCIRTCDVVNSPYCIMLALFNAFKGRLDNGYAFAGANAWRAEKIETVKNLFNSLVEEYDAVVRKIRG